MDGRIWLEEQGARYGRHQELCERAAAQVDGAQFFVSLGPGGHSVAVQMKHLGGNLRSLRTPASWRENRGTC